MIDYSDHKKVLKAFKEDQDADADRRDDMREVREFLYAKDGQWEPRIASMFEGMPQYTLDQCSGLVDDIWGSLAVNDFDIKVRPEGGGATKANARRYDGLIRKIETLSNATQVYKSACRGSIEVGFDCVMANHQYVDSDAFDQDLTIEYIPNSLDRVWFGSHEKQTAEDAPHVTVLGEIGKDEGSKKYKRPIVSLDQASGSDAWMNKRDNAVIGRIFYKKSTPRKLYQMSDGQVLSEDDKAIFDELKDRGVTVTQERSRPKITVMRREFDSNGWLGEAKETPFKHLNVIPIRPYFKALDSKVISRGAVEKRMDEQRIINYTGSRAVDDFALSPKEKLLVGASQAKGREDEFTNYATSKASVQLFDDSTNVNPPIKSPANQGSSGLQQVMDMAQTSLERGSGQFGVNPQNNLGLQSNIALERLENKGDGKNYEYWSATEVAISHLAKVLIGGAPTVYPKGRNVTIINVDNSTEDITLGERIFDDERGEEKEVIDLSTGVYDVVCNIGTAFANRQAEAVDRIISYAQIKPEVLDMSMDVIFSNDSAPGMDVIAERVRTQMVLAGTIPESQLTEEEKALVQQSQEGQAQDPNMLIGQAELLKAQTGAETSQVKLQIEAMKLEQMQQKLNFDQEKQSIELVISQQTAIAKTLNDLSNAVNNLAGTPLAIVPAQQIAELS